MSTTRYLVSKFPCEGWVILDGNTGTVLSSGHESAESAWLTVRDLIASCPVKRTKEAAACSHRNSTDS